MVVGACIAFGLANGKVFDSTSLGQRTDQWRCTAEMIRENPYGVGAGNWWMEFPKYAAGIDYPGAHSNEIYRYPHNDYLWVCSESGIGAMACYLGMFIMALYNTRKMPWLVFGIVGYMVIAFFSAPNERPFPSLVLAVFLVMSGGRIWTIKKARILLPVLIFILVVFGYRLKATCYDKILNKQDDPEAIIDATKGESVFASLTYTGMPWDWWRGRAYLELRDRPSAVMHYRKAFEYHPNNPQVLNGMGIVYAFGNNYEEASKHFREAARIAPDFRKAKENLEKAEKMK